MRRTRALAAASVAALLLTALGAVGAGARTDSGTVQVLSPLSGSPTQPGRGVVLSDYDPSGRSGAEPYFAAELIAGERGGLSLTNLGHGAQPLQPSLDPASGAARIVTFSRCPSGDRRGLPECELFRAASGATPSAVAPRDTPVGGIDRLPSAYGGGVAFLRVVRLQPGLPTGPVPSAEIRYLAPGATTSSRVGAGPVGADPTTATATGIALHARTVAYTWRWNPVPRRVRYAVRVQDVGGAARTLATVDARVGRIIGPVWDRSFLLWAVRRTGSGKTTLYRYDPTTRRTATAPGPASLGTLGVADGQLYWARATDEQLNSGLCPGCHVFAETLPTFRSRPAQSTPSTMRKSRSTPSDKAASASR